MLERELRRLRFFQRTIDEDQLARVGRKELGEKKNQEKRSQEAR